MKINNICKKISKIVLSLAIVIVAIFSSVLKVSAENTVQLGQGKKSGAYIGSFSFEYKVTTDNRYLYCLNYNKSTAKNITADLVQNSNLIDGGVVHILKNGFPTKSITGDSDKDYYITQIAVWWYLDETHGMSNLKDSIKSTAQDPYNIRSYVRALVNDGIQHRYDSVYQTEEEGKLELTTSSKEMKLDGKYYVSEEIRAVTSGSISTYEVTLTNVPTDTVVEKNGIGIDYRGPFTINSNESFIIKVPASANMDTKLEINVQANAKSETKYTAYEVVPQNKNMQNCALLVALEGTTLASSLNLGLSSTRVTVTKIDSVTKSPIAGAVLVLKDSNGKEVTRWTSEVNAHVIRNLPNGSYTITEEKAPQGYIINKKETNFTVSDTSKDIKVTIENAPKKVVVNITKIDQETNAPLAGAVLVVKKADGTEVSRFTTGDTSYTLTDLENGTYYVEEVSAPAGYIKSDKTVEFTIDDEHLSHQITFTNAKEVNVPNTSSVSSVLMLVLGIVITGLGIRFIYKNGKKA